MQVSEGDQILPRVRVSRFSKGDLFAISDRRRLLWCRLHVLFCPRRANLRQQTCFPEVFGYFGTNWRQSLVSVVKVGLPIEQCLVHHPLGLSVRFQGNMLEAEVLALVHRSQVEDEFIVSENGFKVDLGVSFLIVEHRVQNSFLGAPLVHSEVHGRLYQLRRMGHVFGNITATAIALNIGEHRYTWGLIQPSRIHISTAAPLACASEQILFQIAGIVVSYLGIRDLPPRILIVIILLFGEVLVIHVNRAFDHLLNEHAYSILVVFRKLISTRLDFLFSYGVSASFGVIRVFELLVHFVNVEHFWFRIICIEYL